MRTAPVGTAAVGCQLGAAQSLSIVPDASSRHSCVVGQRRSRDLSPAVAFRRPSVSDTLPAPMTTKLFRFSAALLISLFLIAPASISAQNPLQKPSPASSFMAPPQTTQADQQNFPPLLQQH